MPVAFLAIHGRCIGGPLLSGVLHGCARRRRLLQKPPLKLLDVQFLVFAAKVTENLQANVLDIRIQPNISVANDGFHGRKKLAAAERAILGVVKRRDQIEGAQLRTHQHAFELTVKQHGRKDDILQGLRVR